MQNRTPAGFFVRLCAYIIDRGIFLTLLLVFRLVSGITALIIGAGAPKAIFFEFTLTDIIGSVLVWVYFVFLTYTSGATLGKYLMNIRVVSCEDRPPTFIEILIRETVGRFLSGILFIGYIMIFIDSDKRGLHDRICDTRVVYASPLAIPVKEPNVSPHTGFYQSPIDTNDSDSFLYEPETKASDSFLYEPETKDSYDNFASHRQSDSETLHTTESTDKKENEEN